MEIKLTDILIILATLLGPVLAVQAQKFLERGRKIKEAKIRVFKTLMATRAANLSQMHVEAINAVPVEYHGDEKDLKAINVKWKMYFEHLLTEATSPDWEKTRLDLLYQMLILMSRHLDYGFDEVEIKKVYSPKGHQIIESDQEAIRAGVADIFRGKRAIPVVLISQSNQDAPSN